MYFVKKSLVNKGIVVLMIGKNLTLREHIMPVLATDNQTKYRNAMLIFLSQIFHKVFFMFSSSFYLHWVCHCHAHQHIF